ncbi:unnamed protein product [Ambrosiozyma monospora]|uniref:Unnamed protein product n=1 Tax=Ambrosiozyma monospora TaxID=43982 RepID=A0ACB5TDI7_AMBMO|nr:unnamed protein product [Ambrosiozyma monospora]
MALRLKFKRIYQPKSSFDLTNDGKKPDPLPKEPTSWLITLLTLKPAYIIEHAGLDAYLFVRYLAIVGFIALGGCSSFIILFPVNAVGGGGEEGVDRVSMSNCTKPGRYYAHAVVSWFFYGMIMFIVYRELIFYSNLRNLVMSSPAYSKKLSARTVIFQTVTDQYLEEEQFFKLFEGVKTVWVARGQKSLAKKVAKRQKIAMQLEEALTTMLKKAMKVKLKADKKGEIIEPADEMVFYVPQKKRPTTRLSMFSRSVDTIEYCKEQIPKLNSEIEELQQSYRSVKPMNSIAVEFENQYYAQLAYQCNIHDQPFHFMPKHIGVSPDDIIWGNMRLYWWERLPRSTAAISAIIASIIFWAIPVAFVGMISNITYLTNMVHFLKFIYNMPKVFLGLITSLLPTVMLSVLMMVLPMFIRSMGKLRGEATYQRVELFTQQSYFAFQVIQVFLVTTISSSIAATVTQIIKNPTSIMKLLSANLLL